MKFEYGQAPMKYIDNIPAHKAGEWPGIKSCKFHSYKRVIRPVDCGVIFNEKEPLLPPNRKLLGPKGPTPEYIFKPCCRMVPEPGNNEDKPEGLRYIGCPSKPYIPRPERRHEFPYKREMEWKDNERSKKMTNADIVKNEFKIMDIIGFAKRPYLNLTNQQLAGYTFSRDQFGALKIANENNNNKQRSMTSNRKKRE